MYCCANNYKKAYQKNKSFSIFMNLKFLIHYGLHFVVPLIISLLFFKKNWKFTYVVFLLSMLIDLDHLLANPIFEPNRCSINFHPLHSYIAIGFYVLGVFFKKTRILSLALLLHILADYIDCYL
jgi:hypothetical protein